MDRKRKKLLIIIFIMFIIIVISFGFLFKIYNQQSKNNVGNNIEINNDDNVLQDDPDTIYEDLNDDIYILKNISIRSEYYTVRCIIEKYIYAVSEKDDDKIIDYLAPTYINEFDIDQTKLVYEFTQKQNEDQIYYININQMLGTQINERIYVYIITGNASIKYSNEKVNINIMVALDIENSTFNIFPNQYLKKYNINSYKDGQKININIEKIDKRENNIYNNVDMYSDKQMANEIFNDYMYVSLFDNEELYNKLNETYIKNSKITNEELLKIMSTRKSAKISKYNVYSTSDYTDYICTDQYNNYYIFREENGVMNYTVYLDNYTISLPFFEKVYNEGNDATKIEQNISQICQMLNNKDYEAIYNRLNVTFKNNNYKNITDMKNFLENNTYKINMLNVNDYSEKDEYFVCTCELINGENVKETKNMNIIIKFIDSTNFEMSFSF